MGMGMRQCLGAVILAIFFSGLAVADARKDAWYVSDSGDHTVMESLKGSLFATLFMASDGRPNVYFDVYAPEHCREYGERVMDHEPVYVNGTLVKFSQHCRDGWNLFFASTSVGRSHVISQFRSSRSVTLQTLDGTTFIFSAMGFIDHYNKFYRREGAI